MRGVGAERGREEEDKGSRGREEEAAATHSILTAEATICASRLDSLIDHLPSLVIGHTHAVQM